MQHRKKQLIMMAATGMLSIVAPAHALPVIDFGMVAPTPGSIGYAGGAAALTASGIQVDNVVGLATPMHNLDASNCVACVVDFVTGAFSAYDAGTQTWTFSGGGNITVVGGVDFADNSAIADIATGNVLLTGTFNAAFVTKLPTGVFDFRIAGGSFSDTKHADLLAYYGLPANVAYEGGLNLSFSAVPTGSQNGFASTALYSGDITNTPVPVPATLLLLGSGLVGLGAFTRRPRRTV